MMPVHQHHDILHRHYTRDHYRCVTRARNQHAKSRLTLSIKQTIHNTITQILVSLMDNPHPRSNRKNNLDTHVLSLVHNFPVYKDLISTNLVTHHVRWIRGRCDLDLTPLLVCRD